MHRVNLARPSTRGSSVRVSASKGKAHQPSRSVVILPGLGNCAEDYIPLASLLSDRGLAVHVCPVSRLDWSRNASGLIYKEYWTGKLSPRPTVDWYLRKIQFTIDDAKKDTDGGPITLLAHSAGGWMGRVYMKDFGTRGVDRFISLGSPHLPPPKGVIDQTRGILTFVNNECPGSYHDKVQYVTVAGNFIKGAELDDPNASIAQKIAGAGYKQTAGSAAVWGDGIVPVDIAHLDGAIQMTIDGAFHSPLGSSASRPWYGTKGIFEKWVAAVDSTLTGGELEVGEILEAKHSETQAAVSAGVQLD